MKFSQRSMFGAGFAACLLLTSLLSPVAADGPVGDHVNDMQGYLGEYQREVDWLIAQIDGMVDRYETAGREAAQPEKVVDYWEAVKFHSAIESNYIPLYASIWQGLFGVRQAMEGSQSVAEVRRQQAQLEQTLWQSLGAVKLAAQYQEQGLTGTIATRAATTPAATLIEIKQALDSVVAKYAEQLPEEAIKLVQEAYLTRFEGVEGALIERDAELVEDLEIDFNVRLPQAIESGGTVNEVRALVESMQRKLDRARELLEEADAARSEVF